MNWFYSFILMVLVLFYAGCAATGSGTQIGIQFWGIVLTMTGIILLFYLLTRPEEKK